MKEQPNFREDLLLEQPTPAPAPTTPTSSSEQPQPQPQQRDEEERIWIDRNGRPVRGERPAPIESTLSAAAIREEITAKYGPTGQQRDVRRAGDEPGHVYEVRGGRVVDKTTGRPVDSQTSASLSSFSTLVPGMQRRSI